jgi:hypothetical protein
MTLLTHLLKQGLVTGPQPKGSNTSNSSMGACKTFLLGEQQFVGDEKYLIFGRVLHEHLQFIENVDYRSPDFNKLTDVEQSWILGCCESARQHPVVKRLLMKSARENKLYTEIDGIRVALILDLDQQHLDTGADWKSSSCKTEQDFVKKAILYDYIRQALLYKKARNLKHFYFVGLQKQPPHQVYIMDVKQHEAEQFYAAQELKFLLYFYKHYGKITNSNMSTPTTPQLTGKEALKAIAEHYKKVKISAKEHSKLEALHNKMIKTFPAKERTLYAEKLTRFAV